MRAFVYQLLVALAVGACLGGCGEVKAKPDAGGNNGGSDAPMPDADVPPGCTADSFSCGDDDALYQCDADGTALVKVQDCQYGCSVDHCKECAANTMFCSGDDLVTCDADGSIVNPQTCQHGCQMDSCNTCDPGLAYCDGTNAVTCGLDGKPGASMSCGAPGCQGGVCNTCTPNTTACQGDKLVVCNANGAVQSATDCALGCTDSPNSHCKVLEPLYGVQVPSGTLPDLVIDASATLDIRGCSNFNVILTIGGTSAPVPSGQVAIVNQPTGSPAICVVRYGNINVKNGASLQIVNDTAGHVLSLEATGDVQIDGTVTFTNSAPGPSRGQSRISQGTNANNKTVSAGAGGGGAALSGGSGGSLVINNGMTLETLDSGGTGGPAITTIATLLTPGSAGGDVTAGATRLGIGGPGGGGVHLVSLSRVTFGATARIDLNGRGGGGANTGTTLKPNADQPAGGGGSGGTLVVEAPAINISAGAIVAANGGGGAGGCYTCMTIVNNTVCNHVNGQPGQLSATRAAGGDCPNSTFGDGGYEANGVTSPGASGLRSDSSGGAMVSGGGGGGSAGFIILRGRSTSYITISNSAIVSPPPTTQAVKAN